MEGIGRDLRESPTRGCSVWAHANLYHVVTTPGSDSVKGGVLSTGGRLPNYATFCLEVPDVAATCLAVQRAGGTVLVPATTAGDGLVWAHVADPDNNRIGIYAPAPGQAT